MRISEEIGEKIDRFRKSMNEEFFLWRDQQNWKPFGIFLKKEIKNSNPKLQNNFIEIKKITKLYYTLVQANTTNNKPNSRKIQVKVIQVKNISRCM